MYVYWKCLIFFGLAFFLLSCLTDYFRVNQPLDPDFQTYGRYDDIPVEMEKENSLESAILQVVAVALSLVLLAIGVKIGIGKVCVRFRKSWLKITEPPMTKKNSNKVPISLDLNKDSPDLKSSDFSTGSPDKSDSDSRPKKTEKKKSSKINKLLERQCAMLRDEIMSMKTTSTSEQQSLSKKIGTILKEKKDLHRQLQTVLKENRAAKQQLEEILIERTHLAKRLDTAAKEIKIHTKTKKNALTKLEEALISMEKMKQKLDQVSRDKEILEDKLRILEKEYNQLKDQAYVFTLNSDELLVEKDIKEHAVDKHDCGDGGMDAFYSSIQIDDFDISQSEKDMKKVQEKLLNLEKSLEKLKLSDLKQNSSDDFELSWKNANITCSGDLTSVQEEVNAILEDKQSVNSICTEPECQLEHQECTKPECLLRYTQSVKTASSSDTDGQGNPGQVRARSLYRRVKSCEEYEDRLSIISEQSSPTPTDENYEDEEDEVDLEEERSSIWCLKGGKLCENPQFLEILAKLFETHI